MAVWAGVVLFRRWRRKRRDGVADVITSNVPVEPVKEPATPADGFLGLPRDDTEAIQLLRLSQLEGRDAIHDAIIGRFTFDEIQTIVEKNGPAAEWAADLRRKLEQRFNEVVPLALFKTKQET